MEYNSLSEVFAKWWTGETFNHHDILYNVKFIWWSRFGQLLQLVAGFSIVAELLGRSRVKEIKAKIHSLINIKKSLRLFLNRISLTGYELFAPRYEKYFISLAGKDINSSIYYSKTLIYKYRHRIAEWKDTKEGRKYLLFKETKRTRKTSVTLVAVAWSLIMIFLIGFGFRFINDYADKSVLLKIVLCIASLVCSTIFIFLILPVVQFIWETLVIVFLAVSELIFLYPAIGYLWVSEREKTMKLFSFILFLLGFFLTFLFDT